MRVLIVKTSSMGDVIHTLPALTDAGTALPSIVFDWVVEENFAEIPAWHPLVDRVIPVAVRRWRKNISSKTTRAEFRAFCKTLREKKYDLIIDAQGLLKSAFITKIAKGVKAGFDWNSVREPSASLLYQYKYPAAKKQHAIARIRHLFSQALKYTLTSKIPDYGVDRQKFIQANATDYLVFLHGTTWATKHWPEEYWIQLTKIANNKGFLVKLAWGNPLEKDRANRIAAVCPRVEVLPRLALKDIASVLAGAKAIVAVDTGLGHLAAALDVPTVSLYGPTNPTLTGAQGRSQLHISAKFPCAPCLNRECTYKLPTLKVTPPCFSLLPPPVVWRAVEKLLIESDIQVAM